VEGNEVMKAFRFRDKLVAGLFTVLLFSTTLTSCGSGSSTNSSSQGDLHQVSSEKSNSELPENKDWILEPHGPLDDFKNSDEDELIIKIGKWTYMNSCLQKVGHTNDKPKPTLDSTKVLLHPIDYEWGIVSLENAKENGYRSGPSSEVIDETGGKDGLYFIDDEGGRRVIPYKDDNEKDKYHQMGICDDTYNDAEYKFVGFLMTQDESNKEAELGSTAKTQAKSDSKVLSKVREWSTCMKSAGFDYATPQDASSFAWPEEPDEKEKKTAVKDFECKKSTGLMDVWYEVLHEKQRNLIDQYRPILEKSRDQEKKWVEFAQKVIANNGKLD
jgi:hypothetical protein